MTFFFSLFSFFIADIFWFEILTWKCKTIFKFRFELRTIVTGDKNLKPPIKYTWHQFYPNRFFELFEKYDGYRKGHLKLKKPKQLQEVLDIARFLLSENEKSSDPEVCEKKAKLQQLKLVLEM